MCITFLHTTSGFTTADRFSLTVLSALPMWIVYNIATHSWSGVTCEVFVLGSILISVLRYGTKALDQVS